VIALISAYENIKKDEVEDNKETVSIEEYNCLETVLQKYEGSVREHIKVHQPDIGRISNN
jgi:hypothetical protein